MNRLSCTLCRELIVGYCGRWDSSCRHHSVNWHSSSSHCSSLLVPGAELTTSVMQTCAHTAIAVNTLLLLFTHMPSAQLSHVLASTMECWHHCKLSTQAVMDSLQVQLALQNEAAPCLCCTHRSFCRSWEHNVCTNDTTLLEFVLCWFSCAYCSRSVHVMYTYGPKSNDWWSSAIHLQR